MSGIRHFTDLSAVPANELRGMLDDAAVRKARLKAGERSKPLEGKVLAMIFDKPSTRTRVSFDVGMRQLGGETIMLTGTEMQLGRSETIADTAKPGMLSDDLATAQKSAQSTADAIGAAK